MAATDDFSVTGNVGDRLKADPVPDGHPGRDGLVAVADRPPLFKISGEVDLAIGTDGDDGGPVGDQTIGDMLDSGHGFLVREINQPKTVWRVTCEVCDGPLPAPGDDPDWLCQYYDETRPASLTCNCAWCLTYQDYVAGRYKPRGGRPRRRCGSKECERKADAKRKAQKRLQKRREQLLAECSAENDDPPPTLADIEEALSRVDEIPEQYREAVRLRLMRRRDNFDGYRPPAWNRPRRRKEPNWGLNCRRKRASAEVSEKPRN
ncbi:hypothetical protein A5667_24925 [Mycolicibacterium fortuitum]|uniref:hypothetical protein n=1 Tax=Mycolicibacterium fortuitum TaxID=1766 RepID=UPI0007EDBD44|nr:hypothetical protein [Mycolicibacterium fortuitum]OBI54677.1 hypothetical protein A5667_24925 [Mycolicibacterium fortuitum]